ncbi:MAG: hypothetical protein SGJ20_10805 [Planctomycetota bacterium]|nr:hypothetical protein [Planctomycetota bacterium]
MLLVAGKIRQRRAVQGVHRPGEHQRHLAYRGCWAHRDELSDWFRAKAVEAGIEVIVSGVTKLVAESTWKQLPGG